MFIPAVWLSPFQLIQECAGGNDCPKQLEVEVMLRCAYSADLTMNMNPTLGGRETSSLCLTGANPEQTLLPKRAAEWLVC